jgi:hypothetical protein
MQIDIIAGSRHNFIGAPILKMLTLILLNMWYTKKGRKKSCSKIERILMRFGKNFGLQIFVY